VWQNTLLQLLGLPGMGLLLMNEVLLWMELWVSLMGRWMLLKVVFGGSVGPV
jgi:hypothetical protein